MGCYKTLKKTKIFANTNNERSIISETKQGFVAMVPEEFFEIGL
jgi:hypothetical protein